jgi:hypothetical protein
MGGIRDRSRFKRRLTTHCCSTRFARLPYVFGPSVTPLAEQRKRPRRQGLTLRVTRRFFRGHDAEANCSFCHARVVYSVGQERRATAMRTLWDNAPFGFRSQLVMVSRSARKVVFTPSFRSEFRRSSDVDLARPASGADLTLGACIV